MVDTTKDALQFTVDNLKQYSIGAFPHSFNVANPSYNIKYVLFGGARILPGDEISWSFRKRLDLFEK